MALNITLNIYDQSGNQLGRHYLYFGKVIIGSWSGWDWVKNQGFTIDGPWAFDEGNEITSYAVQKQQLSKWIEDGFLSKDSLGRDLSTSFIDSYPEGSIFKLNFMDWS